MAKKKNNNKGLILIIIVLAVIAFSQGGLGPQVVLPCQIDPGTSQDVVIEMVTTQIDTSFAIEPSKIHWRLREETSSGNLESEGDWTLTTTEKTALLNALNHVQFKTVQSSTKSLPIPTTPGYYYIEAEVQSGINQRTIEIQIDYIKSSYCGFPYSNTFQVVATGQCPADGYTTETVTITGGTKTITTYHDYDTNYPTCTDTSEETNWVVTCNAGYIKEGNGANQVCTLCTPDWQTGGWSACVANTQTRAVWDTNNCGIDTGKPAESQACTVCQDTSWTPATSTVCSGTPFTQTSNCDNTRSATGTKDCSQPTCSANCLSSPCPTYDACQTHMSGSCTGGLYCCSGDCTSVCTPGFTGSPICGGDLSKIYKNYINSDCSESTNIFSTCSDGTHCESGTCVADATKEFEITGFILVNSPASVDENVDVTASITIKNLLTQCLISKDEKTSRCNWEVEFGVYPQRLPYTQEPSSTLQTVFDIPTDCSPDVWTTNKGIKLDPGASQTFTMTVKSPNRTTYSQQAPYDYAFDTKLIPTVLIFKECFNFDSVTDWKTLEILPLVCSSPSTEICDDMDNDCDGEIDEGGVCDEPDVIDNDYCISAANADCEAKGKCFANEKKTACVDECMPFFQKWDKDEFDGSDGESGCVLNTGLLVLIGLALVGYKMIQKK